MGVVVIPALDRGRREGPALRFENLTLGYDRHPAIHHLDHAVERGQLVAVVGPNGAGKSTLLKGIVGILSPLEGRIDLGGVGRRDIAYLPQQADIDRAFPITVRDMVAMGLWGEVGAFGGFGHGAEHKVAAALKAVGMKGFEHRPIGTLSGGQMQRTLFARLLLQDAPLILLDEPFAAIDANTANDLMGLIHRWHDEGRTVVTVLHDLEQVRSGFPDTVLLARELIAAGPTPSVLTPRNLEHAHRVSASFDEHAHLCER